MTQPDTAGLPPRFPQALVEADEHAADELTALLFELGAGGVELRDETTLYKGPGKGRVRLVASFEEETTAQLAASALHNPDGGVLANAAVLEGDAWRDKYKEFFKPLKLSASLTVAPPWEDYQAADGELVLVMDPGRAFGTGLHATTSLVAASLEKHRALLAGQPILDVGTGSGILALAALRLGASHAIMTDNDPVAVEVASENASRNALADKTEVSTKTPEGISGLYPRVVANIRAHVLISMADALAARLAEGGVLSLSGVLRSERSEVEAAFAAAAGGALSLEEVTERGDERDAWVCMDWRRAKA